MLNTNASINEASTTRQATRLASEAQAAAVVEAGAVAARGGAEAERDTLELRPGFVSTGDVARNLGVPLDQTREDQRLATAIESLDETAAATAEEEFVELRLEARRLSLTQAQTVEERITWNARASQYETVMTVLGVALFLIGFSLVLNRRIRPPLAVPGLVLAAACFGWALHIYLKPVPDVPAAAISATAEGDPDLLDTLAFTGTASADFDDAIGDLGAALESGGDEEVTMLTAAALASLGTGDWDAAIELLEDGLELNDLNPGLQFALSAAELGKGDLGASRRWYDRAVSALEPLRGTDAARARYSQYLTMLERVAFLEPGRAEQASEMAARAVRAETADNVGRETTSELPAGAEVAVEQLRFVDGFTEVQLAWSGVPADAVVSVVGYELPAEGTNQVQPAELFYSGPVGDGQPITIGTPRICEPTSWLIRF